MKYSTLVLQRQGSARLEEAECIVGGPQILQMLRDAGWLAPAVQSSRLTVFDYEECVEAWRRVRAEGFEELKAAAKRRKGGL